MPGQENRPNVLTPNPNSNNFVNTKFTRDLTDRALSYAKAGIGVHFRGTAGTGKTTLAMHVAALLGRPIVLLFGDDDFGSTDMIGGNSGYSISRTTDNYIHSVVKSKENVNLNWVDHRLTTACREGYTLVYDEFNRSRPEANNVLLSILEERILALPEGPAGGGYVKVHPQFAALFTSNPEEYAGAHKAQDALLDRMITIDMNELDDETETAITSSKSQLGLEDAAKIVKIVRSFRELQLTPALRSAVMIAKISRIRGSNVGGKSPDFRQTCHDVLLSRINGHLKSGADQARMLALLDEIIEQA